MVHYKKLDNGIRLVVKDVPGVRSVTMGIIVNTGAAYESDEENGISHYIEHMMFKGTGKRTAFRISDDMERIGGQMNAYTSKDVTCYYARVITEHAEEAFEILSDFLLNSTFPDEEAAREKNVIIEEIDMNEDTPDDLCLDLLAEATYGPAGLGRNILGTKENVLSFSGEQARRYIAERYTPENIVISMAGNIDWGLAEDMAEKYFGGMRQAGSGGRSIEVEHVGRSLYRKKEIEQVHMALSHPSVRKGDRLYYPTQIMNVIFGSGTSSRLFQTIREKLGLAYSVASFFTSDAHDGVIEIYAGVNAKTYMKSFETINGCIEEMKHGGVTEEEFERGKTQVLSSKIYAQEVASSQMISYGTEMLSTGEVLDYDKVIDDISAVTLEDVSEAIEANFGGPRALSLVGNVEGPLPQ